MADNRSAFERMAFGKQLNQILNNASAEFRRGGLPADLARGYVNAASQDPFVQMFSPNAVQPFGNKQYTLSQGTDDYRDVGGANQQFLGTLLGDPLNLVPAIAPAMKLTGKATNAFGREVARQIETGTGIIGKNTIDPRMYIDAYQGSPNLFDRFDKSKIGSGSGLDYGFGGYFSESPSVASQYMGNEGEYVTTVNDNVIDTPVIKSIIRMGGNPEEFIKILNNKLQTQKELLNKASKEEILAGISDYDLAKLDYNSTLSKLDEAKSYLGKDIKNKRSGNLYKVDIPDETLPYFINWDSYNQTPEVISILKNAGIYRPSQTGSDLYYNTIDKAGSSDAQKSGIQKASEFLNLLGIKGNKYIDRTYGTVAKNPTNYVVYDPEQIKILERNGLLIP